MRLSLLESSSLNKHPIIGILSVIAVDYKHEKAIHIQANAPGVK
jgi:hypothetical protein